MVRQHTAHRLGEATADALVGHLEVLPGLGVARPDLPERLLGEMQRACRRVGLEVGPRPVAFDRIAAVRRNLPFQGDRALQRGLGQVDLHAGSGGFDVTDVHQPGQRRRPQARQGPTSGVECEMVLTIEPAGGHHPAVLVVQVALLRSRVGVLIPRVAPVDRIAQRIGRDEHFLIRPVLVIRTAQQDPEAEIDIDQRGGDQLPIHDDAGGDEHPPTPLLHVLVVEVAHRGILERSPAAEQCAAQTDLLVARQRLVEEVEQVVVHRHDLLHELHITHEP